MGEELPTACKKRINGKFAGFRIWEALRGGITNPAFEKAEQIFHQPAEWNALPQCFHTWQYEALAWSMMSAFLCSIDALMVSVCTSYPLKIFWLLFLGGQELIDFANQVLKDPNCLKDTWTIKFLKKFFTVDLLLSETSTAILLTLLVLLRLDTARIECGHAALDGNIQPGADLGHFDGNPVGRFCGPQHAEIGPHVEEILKRDQSQQSEASESPPEATAHTKERQKQRETLWWRRQAESSR